MSWVWDAIGIGILITFGARFIRGIKGNPQTSKTCGCGCLALLALFLVGAIIAIAERMGEGANAFLVLSSFSFVVACLLFFGPLWILERWFVPPKGWDDGVHGSAVLFPAQDGEKMWLSEEERSVEEESSEEDSEQTEDLNQEKKE